MSDAHEPNADKMPETEELQEPSTEKDPGEEPKDPEVEPDEVDHEAVGIGVIGSADDSSEVPEAASQPDTEHAASESAPDAMSGEAKSAAGVENSDG